MAALAAAQIRIVNRVIHFINQYQKVKAILVSNYLDSFN